MDWRRMQFTNLKLLVFLTFVLATLYEHGAVAQAQGPQRTCSPFYNSAGMYVPEFSCDDDAYPYCCGVCDNKYCCRGNSSLIGTDCDQPSLPLSLIIQFGFAVVATLFLVVLLLAAGWCCKRCRAKKGAVEESDEDDDIDSFGSGRRAQYTSTRRHGFYAPPTRSSGYSSRRPCPCGSPVLPAHAQFCYHGYMNPVTYPYRSPHGYHGKQAAQTIVLQDF
ncbi:uncharacterized protein LOC144873120 [Branchiostoma floridae x Branchiostoma japonicum]